MEWVLSRGKGSCSLQGSTAAAAARSGDLGRLRWLRERGCPMGGYWVLQSALQHADLAVAQWLVDEAGCELPPPAANGQDDSWEPVMQAVTARPDALARLAWLQERGAPSLRVLDDGLMAGLLLAAAQAGQLGLLRHVVEDLGRGRVVEDNAEWFGNAAAASGSIPVAELLRQAGAAFTPGAYEQLPDRADMLGMMRWLATEAEVPLDGIAQVGQLIEGWGCKTPAERQAMREAVQIIVEAGRGEWADGVDRWEASALLRSAARTGDLALVQYLQQQLQPLGGRVDEDVFYGAIKGGCEAVLEWLVEIEPRCARSECPYRIAAFEGDRGTMLALRRLGVQWGPGDDLVRAAQQHSWVQALRWMAEQGAPVGSATKMEEVLEFSLYDDDVKAWLRGLPVAAAGVQA